MVSGSFIPEALEVLAVFRFGSRLPAIVCGAEVARSHDPALSPEQIAELKVADYKPEQV